MTSTRPYLIRAIYEWIVDNNMTPHLLVDATLENVVVPTQYVDDGVIVLNVSPSAVRDLDLSNDAVAFSARFSGTPHDIYVPIIAVQAIYARENGQGIFLGEGEQSEAVIDAPQAEDEAPPAAPRPRGAPHLTVVK